MPRFSSLEHAPGEARRILRNRFARFLPSPQVSAHRRPGSLTLPDESFLHLLQNLTIDFSSDLERAREAYDEARAPGSGESDLDKLIADGWLRVVWGRISTPREIVEVVRSDYAGTMPALASLFAAPRDRVYRGVAKRSATPAYRAAFSAIKKGELEPSELACRSSEWVAARLWDRRPPGAAATAASLREWVDRWHELNYPSIIPSQAWDEAAAKSFRDSALNLLGSEPSLVGWNEMRSEFVAQLALIHKQAQRAVESYFPRLPVPLVDRAQWLDRNDVIHPIMWMQFGYDDLSGLVRLLLDDVAAEEYASAPHGIAASVFSLALDRPAILQSVLSQVRRKAVLLADLLLFPETSALACLLIAQWQSPAGAWDREVTTRDDRSTQAAAFTDAISVFGRFLGQGTAHPQELAALLNWFHQHARNRNPDDRGNHEVMLGTLRAELTHQSPELLRQVVEALAISMPVTGLGTSEFAAALDVICEGNVVSQVDPGPIVSAYIQSLEASAYQLAAVGISNWAAAALFELVERSSPELARKFRYPVDIQARLSAGAAENPYTLADSIARSIRAHIRILSRAIVGLRKAPPEDLVHALVTAVNSGAVTDDANGQIGAFAPAMGVIGTPDSSDHPIAADVGAALRMLADDQREKLLSAVLTTNEPIILAELLAFAPPAARRRIEHRIGELTPANSAEIYSLTQAQARIDAFLAAGLGDAAATFLDAEPNLRTGGIVPGREVARLRMNLHLQLLRGEWEAIAKAEAPSEIQPRDQIAAADLIAFYKGIAALKGPAANPQFAEQTFARLHRQRPDVAAYADNLLAAQVSNLLGNDGFRQLDGAALTRGRKVLDEAEQMMQQVRPSDAVMSGPFVFNSVILLLALRRPEHALQRLLSLPVERQGDTIAALTAVALSRTERAVEANATLDRAEQEFGDTEILRAAREHIGGPGKAYPLKPIVAREDDREPQIKAALWDLLLMDPDRQAKILQPSSNSFPDFVTNHVRNAAASLTRLGQMMAEKKFNPCEDELTVILGELLTSRLGFWGWSAPDQPKGGVTARGNFGEIDLELKKDTNVLAILEAVIFKPSGSDEDLTNHFVKLFRYGPFRLAFHVTYAYVESLCPVLEHLKKIAQSSAPSGWHYRREWDLPKSGTLPIGFMAEYLSDNEVVTVVFLILNIGQNLQRESAITAQRGKSRKGRDKTAKA